MLVAIIETEGSQYFRCITLLMLSVGDITYMSVSLYSMKNLYLTKRDAMGMFVRDTVWLEICIVCCALRHWREQFRHSESRLSLPSRYVVVGYRYEVAHLLGNIDIVTMVPPLLVFLM